MDAFCSFCCFHYSLKQRQLHWNLLFVCHCRNRLVCFKIATFIVFLLFFGLIIVVLMWFDRNKRSSLQVSIQKTYRQLSTWGSLRINLLHKKQQIIWFQFWNIFTKRSTTPTRATTRRPMPICRGKGLHRLCKWKLRWVRNWPAVKEKTILSCPTIWRRLFRILEIRWAYSNLLFPGKVSLALCLSRKIGAGRWRFSGILFHSIKLPAC